MNKKIRLKENKANISVTAAITVLIAFSILLFNNFLNIQSPQGSSVYYTGTYAYAEGVFVSGDYAYIADSAAGLTVIDISDPTNPEAITHRTTSDTAFGVYISGNYAYVAISQALAIINITDPTNLGTPDYVSLSQQGCDVFISGNFAYVADSTAGLAIINVTDPTNPGTPAYVSTVGTAEGIDIDGDFAYIANGEGGLATINISDPINPGIAQTKGTTGWASDIFVHGSYAFLTDSDAGLAIIDVSDPENPGEPIYLDTKSNSNGVFVSDDNVAYVTGINPSSLAAIDISDPINPGTPDYIDLRNNAEDVFIRENYAYVALYGEGFAVVTLPVTSSTNTQPPNNDLLYLILCLISASGIAGTFSSIKVKKFINKKKLSRKPEQLSEKERLKALKKEKKRLEKEEKIKERLAKEELTKGEIKKKILELGTKFARLQVVEISERTGIKDEEKIIDVIQDMIKNKEIYAEYFTSSKSIAFNQQANIDEIDELMSAYKEWEEEKVGKKEEK